MIATASMKPETFALSSYLLQESTTLGGKKRPTKEGEGGREVEKKKLTSANRSQPGRHGVLNCTCELSFRLFLILLTGLFYA